MLNKKLFCFYFSIILGYSISCYYGPAKIVMVNSAFYGI